jgi:hypothetical protein
MTTRTVWVCLVTVLCLWGASALAATDQKGTLVVALDTLDAQTMDPILETRAPHAHSGVFDTISPSNTRSSKGQAALGHAWQPKGNTGILSRACSS